MPRALTAVLATALLLLMHNQAGSTPAARATEAIAQAEQALAQGDGQTAAELLESALPEASAESRPALLDGLRRAYGAAIGQAESSGDRSAADRYREHLAILNRQPGRPAVTEPSAAPDEKPAESASAAPQESTKSPPGDAPVDPMVSRAVLADDSEEPLKPATIEPPSPPQSLDSATEAEPAPAPSASEAPSQPAPKVESPDPPSETDSPTPEKPETDKPPAEESAKDKPPAEEPVGPAAEIAAADAAFQTKRYDEAGRLYAALAARNQLPEVRRDPWAYCRMVEVVRRINARPRTPQEWAWIHAEIDQVRQLSPRNWYAEYLRNLATELSGRGRAGTVVRGASPDDRTAPPQPVELPRPAPAVDRANRPATPDSTSAAVEGTATVGQKGEPVNNWEVWETPNFRIFHNDEALAHRVASAAEEARVAQQARWAGSAARPDWQPRCDIFLFPTGEVFSRMTGQPPDSAGFSTMGLNAGQVVARRINLRADHPNLVAAVLPHEITHVVLADLFPTLQIPRWADEGMAVLAEPPSEQDLRAADLNEPLSNGVLFKVSDLMSMDYPDAQHWPLYYAQSVSLTRFLVEQRTPAEFIAFVQAAQSSDFESELRRVYGIDGYEDLQRRWVEHARSGTTAVASSNRDSEAPGDDTMVRR